jgi:DNA invertase Pin-like site-specific DNA recombinase
MKNRVVVYTRISSDREEEGKQEGLGVARQQEECLKLAEAKGLDVVRVIVDNNKSAYVRTKTREGWEELKALVGDGSITGLVAWHTDRLYRHPLDLEDIIQLVEQKKLTIYTVTAGDMDLNTVDGRNIARILVSLGRREVEHKAERQTAKHKQLAASGHWHGGKLPTGYKQIDGKGPLVIDEPIAEALRASARALLNGHSLRSVTKEYREVTGHMIADTALKRVLVGPVVAGIRIYAPETSKNDQQRLELPSSITQVPAKWDAILDEETWVALKRLLLNPKRKTRGITSEKSLLSGLLICGRHEKGVVCGKSLGYGQKAYICNYTSGGCNKMSISTARIEEFILGQVTALIQAKDYKLPSYREPERDELIEAKRRRLQKNYDDAFELFVAGIIDKDRLTGAKEKLNAQLDEMGPPPRSEAAIRAEQAGMLSVISQWHHAGPPERRMVIKHLIDRIVITAPDPVRAKANGARFDYERAEIQWARWDKAGNRIAAQPLRTQTPVPAHAKQK